MSTESPYPNGVTYTVKEIVERIESKVDKLADRVGNLERESQMRQGSREKGDRTSRLVFALIGGSSAISAIVVGILNLIF